MLKIQALSHSRKMKHDSNSISTEIATTLLHNTRNVARRMMSSGLKNDKDSNYLSFFERLYQPFDVEQFLAANFDKFQNARFR